MPIGIQRINAKKSHPNERIIFIKPLPGPNEKIARDFLERIAAQCLPIMKDNSLSVMSLEEYEPNREFVGRNFNAGEVIQLVLKTRAGRWLPFEYVQMVMMHELAHCKQMNHSRAFWAVRNAYADSMRALWSRGYTGDGLWGRGTLLASGAWAGDTAPLGEGLPEHLCGGTFRSRGRRKRKAKQPRLSYREQKERRILKKFGANGVALGADEAQKVEQEEEDDDDDEERLAKSENVSEDESDYEDDVADIKREDAIDLNGQRLLDKDGRGMIKVCEDENPDDQDAQQELQELWWQGGSRHLSNGVAMNRLNVHSPQKSQR
ncbi:DNA-dependent metalloprotease WSS1 like protein [Verticillium longisporum]|uniref:DNA-dependent metalloprotease WSS1 like protein n=1 Tax=Verticillium longisporum TaxID=100787 RepID=A0A8I2Z574_VERLO|nr:DNA-dependent metalloprotease WSS1 like protein [Verticillium longisporum]